MEKSGVIEGLQFTSLADIVTKAWVGMSKKHSVADPN
jgi:hypothetical protein